MDPSTGSSLDQDLHVVEKNRYTLPTLLYTLSSLRFPHLPQALPMLRLPVPCQVNSIRFPLRLDFRMVD